MNHRCWHFTRCVCGVGIAALVMHLCGGRARAALPEVFLAQRQKTCAALQQPYEKWLQEHATDADVAAFRNRIQMVDDAAIQLLRELESYHEAFLKQSTAVIGRRSRPATPYKRVGAHSLMLQQQPVWEHLEPIHGSDATTQKLLENYYAAYSKGSALGVASYAKSLIVNNAPEAPEIARLSVMLLCLTNPDEPWDPAAVEILGKWLTTREQAVAIEEMALHARHPRTAYWLWQIASQTTTAQKEGYPDYLDGAANNMLRGHDYPAAVMCLRSALAETAADSPRWNDRALHLVQVLGDVNDNDGALQLLDDVLKRKISDDEFGRAAVLRLKHLFAAKKIDAVVSSAKLYRDDSRSEKYLPQVLYIGWVSSRQLDGQESEPWRKTFLEKFPDHPLGADMIFASAMEALANSKYDEAKRLLSYIEYKYPGARIVSKAAEIRKRLEQASLPAASTMPGPAH